MLLIGVFLLSWLCLIDIFNIFLQHPNLPHKLLLPFFTCIKLFILDVQLYLESF